MHKIVITGGPGSGKSTLINKLKELGELVLQESAEILINQSIENKSNILPWIQFNEFEKLLVDFQIEEEHKLDQLNYKMAFLDRGLIDVLAYYEFARVEIPPSLSCKILNHKRYNQIFFFRNPT